MATNARSFITCHNTLDLDMHLHRAELYLAPDRGGLSAAYEGRVFRNEGMDNGLAPGLLLSCNEAYADYHDMMT